jgi:hypothetical protein
MAGRSSHRDGRLEAPRIIPPLDGNPNGYGVFQGTCCDDQLRSPLKARFLAGYAAREFPFIGVVGGNRGNACLGTRCKSDLRGSEHRCAKRRICPGFLPPVGEFARPRLLAAGIGTRSGVEQGAPEGSGRYLRPGPQCHERSHCERGRPPGWRLHQSDLAALGGGSREGARRKRVERRPCSESD